MLKRLKHWYLYGDSVGIAAFSLIAFIGSLVMLGLYFDVKAREQRYKSCSESLCSEGKTPILLANEGLCICEELPRKTTANENN